MAFSNAQKLLKKSGLTLTAYRLRVLGIFLSSASAVTQAEIEERLSEPLDRTTLYRILKAFERNGLIHRVIDLDGIINFALSAIPGGDGNSNVATQHLHFSCMKCKNIFCLDNPAMPNVKLPGDYQVYSVNMTVIGICEECSKPAKSVTKSLKL